MIFSNTSRSISASLRPSARPSFDALFSYGFRPFFLGAAIYAALVMATWIAWLASTGAGHAESWLPVAGSPFAWHAHELAFGFAAAAIGGFLLTAVPNWTGALPLSGLPLVVLFGVWLAGRVAMDASALIPYPLAMGVDLLFLPMLGAFAARQLFVRPAPRNLVFLALVAALTLCNIAFHLGNGGYYAVDPLAAVRTAVLVVVVLVTIVGGRIIPAFTHNWIHVCQPDKPKPHTIPWLNGAAIVSLLLYVVLDSIGAPALPLGLAALIAAVANGARLALWRGTVTRSEPIVWVLHLGYAWIVVALALAALSAWTGLIPAPLVAHAFGTGAVGTMIIAVMSRASLGHTGRRIVAPRAVAAAYYLVTLAAVLRVAGPLVVPGHQTEVLTAAGFAWLGAFALFTFVYAPILTTPRVHTKVARP